MKDPTRIAVVLEELRAAWEGQPDLSLPTLFAMLETRGIGWGTDDEMLVRELRAMQRENPASISGYSREGVANAPAGPAAGNVISARYVIETESPEHRVTVDPFRVSVRRPEALSQPGVWSYERIRTCRVGSPFAVVDSSGNEQRLGIVAGISLLNDAPSDTPPPLTGMSRSDIGDRVFHLVFEDGDTALLDHGLTYFALDPRSVEPTRHRWEKLFTAEPGEPLVIRRPGGESQEFGVVERIATLEG